MSIGYNVTFTIPVEHLHGEDQDAAVTHILKKTLPRGIRSRINNPTTRDAWVESKRLQAYETLLSQETFSFSDPFSNEDIPLGEAIMRATVTRMGHFEVGRYGLFDEGDWKVRVDTFRIPATPGEWKEYNGNMWKYADDYRVERVL